MWAGFIRCRNLEAGADTEAMKASAVYRLAQNAFLENSGPETHGKHYPKWVGHPLSITNLEYKYNLRKSYGNVFSIEVFYIRIALACIKLTKKERKERKKRKEILNENLGVQLAHSKCGKLHRKSITREKQLATSQESRK